MHRDLLVKVNQLLAQRVDQVYLMVIVDDSFWDYVVAESYLIGAWQIVEFLLYKQGQNEVYQRLHLWVDVW